MKKTYLKLYFNFFFENIVHNVKGSLHVAKFAIANVVQVLAQVIRKVERSKIHIAQVKKF